MEQTIAFTRIRGSFEARGKLYLRLFEKYLTLAHVIGTLRIDIVYLLDISFSQYHDGTKSTFQRSLLIDQTDISLKLNRKTFHRFAARRGKK